MLIDDIAFLHTLGAGGDHIIHAQGFEHRGACDANKGCPGDVGEGQDGQDHMPQGIPEYIQPAIQQGINGQAAWCTGEIHRNKASWLTQSDIFPGENQCNWA